MSLIQKSWTIWHEISQRSKEQKQQELRNNPYNRINDVENDDWETKIKQNLQVGNKNYEKEQDILEEKQNQLIKELNDRKVNLDELRKKWKNIYMERVTQEIRNGIKQGNTRIVWKYINQLKKPGNKAKNKNTILKNEQGKTHSEADENLKTMQAYIKKHFMRTREKWDINCITDQDWADVNNNNENDIISQEHRTKHWNSNIQKFARTSHINKACISSLDAPISKNEIDIAINKLNNRKSVGSDEITAECIKANKKWLTPIIQYMYNLSAQNNAMPKDWLTGVMTFIHKKMQSIIWIITDQLP